MSFTRERITRLLRPDSVAVLGASAQRFASGNEVLANLREERFGGDIHVVHPTATKVDGFAVLPDPRNLPDDVDVAVVSLPARKVVNALRGLEERGCNAALVPTSGFDQETAAEFKEFAAQTSMLVHGPNNMGIVNLTDRIPLWLQHGGISRLRPGNVGLIGQSGSATIFVPRSSRDGMYSKLISSGSEWQLTAADYIQWLAGDDATEAIGVVLESIPDLGRFRAACAEARAAGKPLAVLKVGRTHAGVQATVAHTGAMAAPDESYRALFGALDIPMVDDYDELAAVLEAYSRPRRNANGPRLAATTISGGQSALLADLGPKQAVEFPALSESTRARLEELLPGGAKSVPLDLESGTSQKGSYADVLQAVTADENVDAVMVVVDAQQTLSLSELEIERPAWEAINQVYAESSIPILVASSSSVSLSEQFVGELTVPVAVIRGLVPALAAVRALAMNQRPLEIEPTPDRSGGPDPIELGELRASVGRLHGVLPDDVVRRLLRAYGIAEAADVLVSDRSEAVDRARRLTYPLVAKIVSPAIPHRTEAGCVITSITDGVQLTDAVATILERGRALVDEGDIVGVMIQQQLDARLEAVVGFTSSSIHSPYVVVGSGGVLVELMADTAGDLAPVSTERALQLISETKFGQRLGGYRGLVPPTDPHPLADLVRRVSLLAADFKDLIGELDLNPVLVQPETGQAFVVDALAVATTATAVS